MRRFIRVFIIAMAIGLVADDAFAVIGRPLTPVSYAGVARRTSRRTVRRTAYVAGAATTAAATAAVTTLPAGCGALPGPPAYNCNGVVYRPAYQGTTVVYVPQ